MSGVKVDDAKDLQVIEPGKRREQGEAPFCGCLHFAFWFVFLTTNTTFVFFAQLLFDSLKF